MGCAICVRSGPKITPEDPQPKLPSPDPATNLPADTQRTAPNDGTPCNDPVPDNPAPQNDTEDAGVSRIPSHFLQSAPHNHIPAPTLGHQHIRPSQIPKKLLHPQTSIIPRHSHYDDDLPVNGVSISNVNLISSSNGISDNPEFSFAKVSSQYLNSIWITSDQEHKLHKKNCESGDSMKTFGIGDIGVLRRHTNTTGNHDSSGEFLPNGGRFLTGESSEKKGVRSSNQSIEDQKKNFFRSNSGVVSRLTFNRKGEAEDMPVFENNSDLGEGQFDSPRRKSVIILRQEMEIKRLNLILEQKDTQLGVFNEREQGLVVMPVIQEASPIMESVGPTGSKNYTNNSKPINSGKIKTGSSSVYRLSGFSNMQK
jgi:hypothetical protein